MRRNLKGDEDVFEMWILYAIGGILAASLMIIIAMKYLGG